MTRRTSGPRAGLLGGGGDLWTDGLLLGAAGAVVALTGASLLWAAGTAISVVSGRGVGPGVLDIVRILGSGGDLHEVWPDVQVPVALAAAALLTVGVGAAGWAVATRWMAAYPARDGYARPSRFADLLPGKVGTAKARRLRACLSARRPAHNDLGVPLGRFRRRGPRLRASWEDVVLAICAPRSGKTTCLAVPPILDAPGPVLVTSNKTDVWTLTSTLRATDTGQRTWTFDPQQITRTDQAFAWDALAGVATVADARRLAGHFIQEIRRHADAGDFWDRDAEDLLTGLLLAAALKGAGLGQVGNWLTAVSSVEPRNILTRAGFTQLAEVMTGRSQGAVETREGVYATARAAAACLSDPAIMAWVTPHPGLNLFDPAFTDLGMLDAVIECWSGARIPSRDGCACAEVDLCGHLLT